MGERIARPQNMPVGEQGRRGFTADKLSRYTWRSDGSSTWCYECECGERLFHVAEDPSAWVQEHKELDHA